MPDMLCNSVAYGNNLSHLYRFQMYTWYVVVLIYSTRYMSHVKIYVLFSYTAPGDLLSFMFAEQKTRQQDGGILACCARHYLRGEKQQ